MAEQESWLPNLVGGVSIWKLAVDLNDPKFMDGRLLEPDTEGSDSLPARVSWDLTGLVPLRDARHDHPVEVEKAIAAFFACLEKVREQLEDEDSGYDKYREAFTIPGLDVDDGGHYFYGPESGKLYVIDWGASPRSIQHEQAFLFGYDSFRELYDQEGIEPAAAAGPKAAAADAEAAAAGAAEAVGIAEPAPKEPDKKGDEKAEEKAEEKDDEGEGAGRPWWVWLLVALGAIALVVILLLLLQQCDEQQNALQGSDAGADAGQGGATDAGADATAASTAGGGGSGGEGGSGGGDPGSGGAGGAGTGGAGPGGADDGSGGDDSSGGTTPIPAPGVVPGGGGTFGGTVQVIPGGGAGSGSPPPPTPPQAGQSHRAHFHPGAIAWRVQQGYQHVDSVQTEGRTYHVYLKPGATFEKVRVQWQDRNGRWHDH